jgi:hypothetical protein
MPTSAVAVETLVEILVSVKRPVTNEGLTSNVTPFPFEVEIFVVKEFTVIPPLRAPEVASITHAALLPEALKLPLDCAKASGANNIAIANGLANFFLFIIWLFSNFEAARLRTLRVMTTRVSHSRTTYC